ncbi:MAG: hypothetical protein GF331_18840 [Chitinivibrionales bacterium]|nr:hypothetical protein [Chitinivibrionales bacterium]
MAGKLRLRSPPVSNPGVNPQQGDFPMFWQKAVSVLVFFAAFILPMTLLFAYIFIWPVLKRDRKQQ